jgi:hypothetical protein
MKLLSVAGTRLTVELMLRDEHCPPHVHVEDETVPWEARFAFSFVGNAVRLMDIDPLDAAPTLRTINRVQGAIAGALPACRRAWWAKIGTCCLDNRWVRIEGDHVTILTRRAPGALQVAAAHYDATEPATLTLSLHGRPDVTMLAGAGTEQWKR